MARILVVEDNPGNLKLAMFILESAGHEVVGAEDAATALAIAAESVPDLILMDIQMPGMDGYQALSSLRALEATKSVPVIATTAHAMKGDPEKIQAAGFDDYICKPFRYKDFLSAVASLVEAGERSRDGR